MFVVVKGPDERTVTRALNRGITRVALRNRFLPVRSAEARSNRFLCPVSQDLIAEIEFKRKGDLLVQIGCLGHNARDQQCAVRLAEEVLRMAFEHEQHSTCQATSS